MRTLIILAALVAATSAQAGMTCRQIGYRQVCTDDGGDSWTGSQVGSATRWQYNGGGMQRYGIQNYGLGSNSYSCRRIGNYTRCD